MDRLLGGPDQEREEGEGSGDAPDQERQPVVLRHEGSHWRGQGHRRDLSGKLSARGAELSTEIECTAG